jgi:hypothetical protein
MDTRQRSPVPARFRFGGVRPRAPWAADRRGGSRPGRAGRGCGATADQPSPLQRRSGSQRPHRAAAPGGHAGAGTADRRSHRGHRAAVAQLSHRADAFEVADPAYRAELRAWTTLDPNRRDGVPALAVPHVDAGSGDDIPIREFDSHGAAFCRPRLARPRTSACWCSARRADPPPGCGPAKRCSACCWRSPGTGFVATPLTQAVEIPATRAALREALSLDVYPQVLLRVGRAPVTPATRRRSLAEIMVDRS